MAPKKTEFFMKTDKVQMVKSLQSKIERMYDIEVTFEERVDDGQWIAVSGENIDRRNAKDYIIALCQPSETQTIQLSKTKCKELINPDNLEQIEKKTNAVVKPLQNVAEFEISGTELAVTLALSKLEELAADEDDSPTENNDLLKANYVSPDARHASERLSSTLQRVLSQNSDGHCSVDDYKEAPAAVKRALVNCLQEDDIDEELLFAEEDQQPQGHPAVFNDTPLPPKVITPRKSSYKSIEIDGSVDKEIRPSEVDKLAEQFTETLKSKQSDEVPMVNKQHEYLKTFGISIGYSQDEISEALNFVDDKTRPSDFLEYLKKVTEKDVTPKETSLKKDSESSSQDTGFPSVEGLRAGGSPFRRSDLPVEYMTKLLEDPEDDEPNLSRVELMKRCEERQKVLQKHFESEQKGKVKGSVTTKQSRKQGNQKQGGNQKQTKGNKQAEKGHTQGNKKTQSPNRVEKTKSSKADSCDVKPNCVNKDSEQTCVFQLWQADDDSSDEQWKAAKRKHPNKSKSLAVCPQQSQDTAGHVNRSSGQFSVGQFSVGQSVPQHQAGIHTNHQISQKYHTPKRQQADHGTQFTKPVQLVSPTNVVPPNHVPNHTLYPPSEEELRYIIIDGSNVAMTHGNGKTFSCKGLQLCVEYFKQRGHTKITIFVPQWRTCRPSENNLIENQEILHTLKEEEFLVFTPSRQIGRKLVASYDDRFVLELAEAEEGIIVSNDQYRDLMREKASWRKVIEERLLMFSYVRDRFMPPSDPLGRDGPTLDDFLRKPRKDPSPVNLRNMAVFPTHFPPPNKSQRPVPIPQQYNYPPPQSPGKNTWNTPIQKQWSRVVDVADGPGACGQSPPRNPRPFHKHPGYQHTKVQQIPLRTREETDALLQELRTVFPEPDQLETISKVLSHHETDRDITKLTNYCMNVLYM